jgi:enoyl-CoA hydratase
MTDEVLFTEEGQLGIITLNRPKALNALTFTMICSIQKQLSLWKKANSIEAVLVQAVPGNAFCAGGDIRSLYNNKGKELEQSEFFWHEYRLNHFIHHLGKPYVSLIDGMVMGGGVGISLHGSHPIASERFVFAMPETGIGFFPDIGASYLLARCPGYLGVYLGLTGNRLGPQEALAAGLIKQILPSEQIPKLINTLKNADLFKDPFKEVDRCVQEHLVTPSGCQSNPIKPELNACFAQPTVEAIKRSLEKLNEDWALTLANTLSQKSPLSLKITLAQLHKAKGLTLAQCLQMDYTLMSHFIKGHDLYEGIRALLIDKDKNPQWNPSELEGVREETVEGYFAPTHFNPKSLDLFALTLS